MRGADKHTNVILEKCYERVFSASGTEIVELGLYIVRGDNMCVTSFSISIYVYFFHSLEL